MEEAPKYVRIALVLCLSGRPTCGTKSSAGHTPCGFLTRELRPPSVDRCTASDPPPRGSRRAHHAPIMGDPPRSLYDRVDDADGREAPPHERRRPEGTAGSTRQGSYPMRPLKTP